MSDLWSELREKTRQLDMSTKMLRKSGDEYAQAEMDYKVLLRQEILKLRDAGTAVGLVQMIAYGIPEVARARFKRDVAENMYEANKEAINTLKLEIRILDAQIEREWKG